MKETVYLLHRKLPPSRLHPEGTWVPDGNEWLSVIPPFQDEAFPEGEYAVLTGKRDKPDELPTAIKWLKGGKKDDEFIKVTHRKQPKPKVEGL